VVNYTHKNRLLLRHQSMEAQMESYRLTLHAQQRCRQRGITKAVVDLVTRYGTCHFQKGCELIFLEERDIKFLVSEVGVNKNLLDRIKNIYVICAGDTVVTVAHKKGKFKSDYWMH